MTVDLESKINGITDDLADLVRNLDEKKAALQAQDKLNLLNDKRRKGDGLEKSRQDLLDQIEALKRAKEEALAGNGICGVSDKVLKAIEDRQAALEKQLNELDNLRRTKQDQEREKDKLEKQLKWLGVKNNRYDDEIGRLQDEKETLADQVGDLEQLL